MDDLEDILPNKLTCDFWWGTRGCDLPIGHGGTVHHDTSVWAEFDEAVGKGRSFFLDEGFWSGWNDSYGERGRGWGYPEDLLRKTWST